MSASPCATSDSPCATSDEDGSHAQLAGKRSASELLTSDNEEVDRPVTKKPATQATRKKPAAESTRKKPSAAPDNPLMDASTPDACDAGDNPRIPQELGSIVPSTQMLACLCMIEHMSAMLCDCCWITVSKT